jgi:hypothetical protein
MPLVGAGAGEEGKRRKTEKKSKKKDKRGKKKRRKEKKEKREKKRRRKEKKEKQRKDREESERMREEQELEAMKQNNRARTEQRRGRGKEPGGNIPVTVLSGDSDGSGSGSSNGSSSAGGGSSSSSGGSSSGSGSDDDEPVRFEPGPLDALAADAGVAAALRQDRDYPLCCKEEQPEDDDRDFVEEYSGKGTAIPANYSERAQWALRKQFSPEEYVAKKGGRVYRWLEKRISWFKESVKLLQMLRRKLMEQAEELTLASGLEGMRLQLYGLFVDLQKLLTAKRIYGKELLQRRFVHLHRVGMRAMRRRGIKQIRVELGSSRRRSGDGEKGEKGGRGARMLSVSNAFDLLEMSMDSAVDGFDELRLYDLEEAI